MKWKIEYVIISVLIFLRLAFSWWVYTNGEASEIIETIGAVTIFLDLVTVAILFAAFVCWVTDCAFFRVENILIFSNVLFFVFLVIYVLFFDKKISAGQDPIGDFFKVSRRKKELGDRFTKQQVRIILWVEEWAGSDYLYDFRRAVKDDYFIAAGGLIFLKILGDIKALHLKTENKYDEKVFAAIKKTKTLMGAIRDKIYILREEESRAEKNAYYEFHARRTKIISELVEEGIKDVEFLYGVTKN